MWEKRRILIWGKTRPELSKTYREIVCTGGVFEDTQRLVRLYPIPLRYMDDAKYFKKYQWIEADVMKASNDARPESYKIRDGSITVLNHISTKKGGNWDERAAWVMRPENVYSSVEALQDKQKLDLTSLGLVKPKVIYQARSVRYSKAERDSFWQRYKDATAQMDLPLDPDTGHEVKPLTPPDFRFKIEFTCDDPRCSGHEMSVLDWEIDALYFTMLQNTGSRETAAKKVIEKLTDEVCASTKDTHFFLGNISNHPTTFTVVGLWWPSKKKADPQLGLFA